MTKPIYILNGPNLNLLGDREPEIYGSESLQDIEDRVKVRAKGLNLDIEFRQSNSETQLIDWIQEARKSAAGLIVNAGAYTHTSIAMLDALQASNIPVIEVHLSNIFAREEFRRHSYISPHATGVICGLGPKGYEIAIEAMADVLSKNNDSNAKNAPRK